MLRVQISLPGEWANMGQQVIKLAHGLLNCFSLCWTVWLRLKTEPLFRFFLFIIGFAALFWFLVLFCGCGGGVCFLTAEDSTHLSFCTQPERNCSLWLYYTVLQKAVPSNFFKHWAHFFPLLSDAGKFVSNNMFFHPGKFSWLYYSSGTRFLGQQDSLDRYPAVLFAAYPGPHVHTLLVWETGPPVCWQGGCGNVLQQVLSLEDVWDLHQGVIISRLVLT